MPRMTVVMTVMARSKTCFPAAIAVIATKAEPSEDAKVFCILFIHVGIADARMEMTSAMLLAISTLLEAISTEFLMTSVTKV